MRPRLWLWLAVICSVTPIAPPLLAHPGSVGADHCHICYDDCESYGLKWGQRHCHPDRQPGIPASVDTHPGEKQIIPQQAQSSDQASPQRSETPPVTAQARAVVPPVFSATVVGVSAGDVLTVRDAGRKRQVQLYGIVAPSKGQPWAKQSRHFAKERVYQQTVIVIPKALGDGSAIRAQVILSDGQNLGHLLLQQGLARWDVRTTDAPILSEMEHTARMARKGLWSE